MMNGGQHPLKPDKFSTHTLRHTFCSQRIQRGDSIYQVKELAGHKSVQTTEKYIHTRPELKEKMKYW